MSTRSHLQWSAIGLVLAASASLPAVQQAPSIPDTLFAGLKWRPIGPMRGGRTCAVAGHRSRPYTFYIGVCNGGVWKTTDAGTTWTPVFDDQPTQSIGALAIAPSDPNVIYVGSGEGLHRPDLSVGDGLFKSIDAGRTWTHLGLRDAQQITEIAVDPRDADRLFVAVLGHPYGPNTERGIYRSVDGGRTLTQVFARGENTGARDVDLDPSNPDIVYATFWEARQGPWENAAWGGTNGGVFKSVDGGATWRQLTNGLPQGLQHAELSIAPSNPRRLYAIVAGGGGGRGAGAGGGGVFYRSDDGGETWTKPTTDNRAGNQRVSESNVVVYPNDPDAVIVTDIVSFKSMDGGRTWVPFKGAPGGEDYQGAWINPDNPDVIITIADQGAVVTLNGGATWTTWFNQPTAQLYHIAADANFPYRVCSGQQESGSACVATRGNYGAVSIRDWLPVGVDEYGYVAPDPLNPHFVYGGRSVTRFDYRTGQTAPVGPVGGRGGGAAPAGLTFRQVRTQPVVFSEADRRMLLFGNNYLWKTIDGGITWTRISDDLTRTKHDAPKSIGTYAPQAGPQLDDNSARVIYTIGPSPLDANRIWIGTDDGVIQTTADGGLHWTDVTPPQIGSYWKVFMIDAGRFDTRTAYAAVNTLRLDDMRPYVYRTHDAGKTWTPIVNGMEGAGAVNAVREDPKRRGLLYASTEKGVYVSFDDGNRWQSLRLNLPASSVRDLIVKDDDLAVATHGRGFWILDDITPLRQIDAATAARDVVLFNPATAWRVRWNTSTDMPWPKDEPTLPNPPEGTPINYYLRSATSSPVTLEILSSGRLVRRYSSDDQLAPVPDVSTAGVPVHWYRPPRPLAASAGMHRFYWDLRYQPLGAAGGGRGGGPSIQAIPYNSAPAPTTPLVAPGTYTVRLTVDGKSLTAPITVKQDPRVKTSAVAMQQVYSLTSAAYFGARDARDAQDRAGSLRAQVAERLPKASGAAKSALEAFDRKLTAIAGAAPPPAAGAARGGGAGGRGGGAPAAQGGTLAGAAAALGGLVNSLGAADAQPTSNQVNAITTARTAAATVMARWRAILNVDLPALNAALKGAGIEAIK